MFRKLFFIFSGTLDEMPVAIKSFKESKDKMANSFRELAESSFEELAEKEILVMSKVDHRHLVKLYGYCLSEYYIIAELMPHGDLLKYLRKAKRDELDITKRIHMAYQVINWTGIEKCF